MDNLDIKIEKIFKNNKKNTIPSLETEKVIKETLFKINLKNKHSFKHSIAAIFAILCISINVAVFASDDIVSFIHSIFNYDNINEKGIQTAVNNGYIQNTNMEYLENSNVKFKVDYISMDDSTLALNFNFLLNENAESFQGISIYNLKIYDDNNSLIYTEEEQYPNDGISLGIGVTKVVYIRDNNIVQSLLIKSDRFPKTKTLRLTFDKITLYDVNKGNPITKDISGNFDIKLNLDEKFYNRKTLEYAINEIKGINDFKIEKAFLTDTSFNIIVNKNDFVNFEVQLEDLNGNIIYTNDSLNLYEVNDNTNRKIARIDISKYDDYSENIKLIIKAKKMNSIDEKTIYFYDANNRTNVYDIKEIKGNYADSTYEIVGLGEYNLQIK